MDAVTTVTNDIHISDNIHVVDPWVHRGKNMRCETCMWFVFKKVDTLKTDAKPNHVGRCRRHAPTMNGYPVVYGTDWCGDHKVDENKI